MSLTKIAASHGGASSPNVREADSGHSLSIWVSELAKPSAILLRLRIALPYMSMKAQWVLSYFVQKYMRGSSQVEILTKEVMVKNHFRLNELFFQVQNVLSCQRMNASIFS